MGRAYLAFGSVDFEMIFGRLFPLKIYLTFCQDQYNSTWLYLLKAFCKVCFRLISTALEKQSKQ